MSELKKNPFKQLLQNIHGVSQKFSNFIKIHSVR